MKQSVYFTMTNFVRSPIIMVIIKTGVHVGLQVRAIAGELVFTIIIPIHRYMEKYIQGHCLLWRRKS